MIHRPKQITQTLPKFERDTKYKPDRLIDISDDIPWRIVRSYTLDDTTVFPRIGANNQVTDMTTLAQIYTELCSVSKYVSYLPDSNARRFYRLEDSFRVLEITIGVREDIHGNLDKAYLYKIQTEFSGAVGYIDEESLISAAAHKV